VRLIRRRRTKEGSSRQFFLQKLPSHNLRKEGGEMAPSEEVPKIMDREIKNLKMNQEKEENKE
jgi:hypothetical protein